MKHVVIFDLNFMTYTYHSTPQASMYAMLISGWHKSRGDKVVFTDEPPTYKLYDIVYIIKDRIGIGHLPEWLFPENVVPVGNYWDKVGVKSFYNPEWETTPPDNTIYWGWLDRWTTKYAKYNKARLEHFYREPVKIMQRGKKVWPEGKGFLILDNDMKDWDYGFEEMMQQNLSQIRFAYPIPIDGRWEEVLTFTKHRQAAREYLFLDMFYENYSDEDFIEASKIWAKYKQGRMVRLHLNVDLMDNDSWLEALPRIYKALADFRMRGGKMLRVQPFNIDTFEHPRILKELKRWTGRGTGYAKNSLFDYILFDGVRDQGNLLSFLSDPDTYVKNIRKGSNKLPELLAFAKQHPDLLYIITESYPRGAS